MNKIKGLIRLIRFELPFSAGICVVMGQMLALGEFASSFITISGFMSVFLISASILVLNDYFDFETDRINAPERPIASGLILPSEAVFFSILLLFAGLYLSFLISISALVISLFLMITGFLYNRYFKKSGLPGNLMVSFSVGMTFIYGGATVNLPFNKIVIFFFLIASLIDLGEEIAADSLDVKGDLIIKSNSLAIRYGRSTAVKISSGIFLSVIILSFIPFIINWFSFIYLIPITIMDLSIFYPSIKLLNNKNEEGRKFIRWIYLGATFGLVVFLIMRLNGIQ